MRVAPYSFVLCVVAALAGGTSATGVLWAGGPAPEAEKPPKIVPCFSFDNAAEEAIRFYVAVLPDSRVLSEMRAGSDGKLVVARIRLAGQELMALNAGPQWRLSEAASLLVNCADQAEVDALWAKLTSDGGAPGRCGWLKDRFGLSWQVIPTVLGEMLADKDPARVQRVTAAMLSMGKIDVEALRRAYDGR